MSQDIQSLLRQAADEIASEGHNGWGNLMTSAADHIEALERQLAELRQAHELPAELFDGYTVYRALTEHAKKRTSYENVADALDALAKVMTAGQSQPGDQNWQLREGDQFAAAAGKERP
jgi:hypothetical protein